MPKCGADSGHGGCDPGSTGSTGLQEKTVTLAVTKHLNDSLFFSGYDTAMTRTTDVALGPTEKEDLAERCRILNREKCDLVVSVHCNASADPRPNYISTWICAKGGEAEKAAKLIQAELVKTTGWPDGGVRLANFQVLRDTDAPAVLVELGFITNPDQEKRLRDPEFQKALGYAIARAAEAYLPKPTRRETKAKAEAGPQRSGNDAGVEVIKAVIQGTEYKGIRYQGTAYIEARRPAEFRGEVVMWDEPSRTLTIE